jgi:hypothetical protein
MMLALLVMIEVICFVVMKLLIFAHRKRFSKYYCYGWQLSLTYETIEPF